MKKILLLVLLSFSLLSNAQHYIGKAVQLGVTPVANTSDFILANGTHSGENGIISKTAITVQQLTDAIGGGSPTTPNIQQVLGAGNYSTLGIDFANAGISLSNGNYYSELYASAFTMNESVSGASFNNAAALSPLSFNISKDNGVGVSISTEMQATGVIMLEGGSLTTELTKDELRQYSGSFYGATKVTPSLTANRTYTMPDKDIEVAGLKDVVTFVGSETVAHTNASLNTKYPIANHPVGTMETLRFNDGLTVKVRLYVRVTSTEWVKFVGATL